MSSQNKSDSKMYMEQKGLTFDHNFCYFFLLFSSLLKKEGREKENEVAKKGDQKSYLSVPSISKSNSKAQKKLNL